PFNQRLFSLCNGRLKWQNATLAFSSITEWWFCWTTDAYSRLAWTRTLTSIWMSLPLQRALIGRYIKDRPGYEGSNQGNHGPCTDHQNAMGPVIARSAMPRTRQPAGRGSMPRHRPPRWCEAGACHQRA